MLDLNHFIDLYNTLPNYYQKKKRKFHKTFHYECILFYNL